MLIITSHAVDRYKERLNKDISVNDAFNKLLSELRPRTREIEDVLCILEEARIDVGDGLRAICIMEDREITVVTVRNAKWK